MTTSGVPGGWVTGEERTALLVLIGGRFRVELPGRSVLLGRQGDYVVGPGRRPLLVAEEESVVLAVRPRLRGDRRRLTGGSPLRECPVPKALRAVRFFVTGDAWHSCRPPDRTTMDG
ncbi:hypothetical protein GCM10010518_28500 [Kitasatospora cinereorecta]